MNAPEVRASTSREKCDHCGNDGSWLIGCEHCGKAVGTGTGCEMCRPGSIHDTPTLRAMGDQQAEIRCAHMAIQICQHQNGAVTLMFPRDVTVEVVGDPTTRILLMAEVQL